MNTPTTPYPTDDFSLIENGAVAGRYLAKFWQPIAISRDLARSRAKRIQILGQFYTLYRGDDDSVNLVQDRCPHRGTSLAYGWVEGTSIRCRYHGWKFSCTGQGEHFPAETATYARSICIKAHPVRDYLGVIFGYLGEGEAPEFPRFPELEDESAGELLSLAVVLPYNYFQRVENDVDEVHIHYTHGEFAGSFGLVDIPKISAKETEYGMVAIATRADGSKLFTHVFMPNVMLREVVIQQDLTNLTIHAAWRVPIDDVSTLSVMIDRVANPDRSMHEKLAAMEDPRLLAERIMAGEMTLDEMDANHPLLPVVQDTVCMKGQGIIADRKAEHLGASDRAIGLLRKIWTRELNAVAESRPVTPWKRSDTGKLKTSEPGSVDATPVGDAANER
jgi:5,5'-dehydrodivanillate O-demethylase oxygenase subunit